MSNMCTYLITSMMDWIEAVAKLSTATYCAAAAHSWEHFDPATDSARKVRRNCSSAS